MTNHLNIFVAIRTTLSDVQITNGSIIGLIGINEEVVAQLKQLAAVEVLEDPIQDSGKSIYIDSLARPFNGRSVRVALFPANLRKAIYFETVEELVAKYPIKAPDKAFYIHELCYYSSSDVHSKLEPYYNVHKLLDLLRKVCDYQIPLPPGEKLVFFTKTKVELIVEYKASDLVPLAGIDSLYEEIVSPHDSEQRLELFKNVVVDTLKPAQKPRLSFLLQQIDSVADKYKQSYKLYLANFSWEKVKAAFDKEKMDFVKKLNGAVNDVQTKLIAVPAAFLLIVTQFERTGSYTLKNFFLVVVAFIFSLFVHFLVKNQENVLKAVSDDINDLEKKLDSEYGPVDELGPKFKELRELYSKQHNILSIVLFVNWMVTVVSIGLFFIYSTSA